MKYAINKCFGGFILSNKAEEMLEGVFPDNIDLFHITKDNLYLRATKDLIDVVEALEKDAGAKLYSQIEVVNIPDSATDVTISNYDGKETLYAVIDGKIKEY